MKRKYFLLGLVCFSLVACNSRPSVSKFVGSWKAESEGLTMNFAENGQLTASAKTAKIQGSWEFKDDRNLLIKSKTTFGSGESASNIKNDDSVRVFRFEGDDVLFLGEPPQQIKLVKIK